MVCNGTVSCPGTLCQLLYIHVDACGMVISVEGAQMTLGLCVVGCGAFARTFAQAMQSIRDEVELFFASRDVERARTYAATFGGRGVFGSYEAAAADPRVEALYLCTPHHLHR